MILNTYSFSEVVEVQNIGFLKNGVVWYTLEYPISQKDRNISFRDKRGYIGIFSDLTQPLETLIVENKKIAFMIGSKQKIYFKRKQLFNEQFIRGITAFWSLWK